MKFQYKIPDSPCLRRKLSFCRSRRHINSCTSLERSWRQRLMRTLTIIIVVVVIVDDDIYYWVYLSSDPLFQVCYKVRQVLLQSATAFLLQSATCVITKCDRYYKVRQYTRVFFYFCAFLYRSRKSACKITIFQVLQRTLTHRHKFEFFFSSVDTAPLNSVPRLFRKRPKVRQTDIRTEKLELAI